MSTQLLHLLDSETRDDLQTYLERLQRVAQPEVRMVSRGRVLAVFGCTQSPLHLTDPVPVVLGSRGFYLEEAPDLEIDLTVEGRALLDRIARMADAVTELPLPDTQVTAAWAGVLPPAGGWSAHGVIDAGSMSDVAQQGIDRVASLLPDDPGEAVVRKVRSQVWGLDMLPGIPASAAFAAEGLGFLRGEATVLIAETRGWIRLSTEKGQVLVRKPLL